MTKKSEKLPSMHRVNSPPCQFVSIFFFQSQKPTICPVPVFPTTGVPRRTKDVLPDRGYDVATQEDIVTYRKETSHLQLSRVLFGLPEVGSVLRL